MAKNASGSQPTGAAGSNPYTGSQFQSPAAQAALAKFAAARAGSPARNLMGGTPIVAPQRTDVANAVMMSPAIRDQMQGLAAEIAAMKKQQALQSNLEKFGSIYGEAGA